MMLKMQNRLGNTFKKNLSILQKGHEQMVQIYKTNLQYSSASCCTVTA